LPTELSSKRATPSDLSINWSMVESSTNLRKTRCWFYGDVSEWIFNVVSDFPLKYWCWFLLHLTWFSLCSCMRPKLSVVFFCCWVLQYIIFFVIPSSLRSLSVATPCCATWFVFSFASQTFTFNPTVQGWKNNPDLVLPEDSHLSFTPKILRYFFHCCRCYVLLC